MQRVERSLASVVDDHVIKCAHLFPWGGDYIRNSGGRLQSRPDDGLLDAAGNYRRAGSTSERLVPVRVILPVSAEPAQPPQPLQPQQPVTTAIPSPESQPQAQQVREVQAPLEKVEKPDTRRAAEQRERRLRSAERKAKKLATARARQQLARRGREREPGILAFGGNEQPRMIGFLGN